MGLAPLFLVLVGFGIAFIFVPWVVLPRPKSAKSRLDALTINFLRWMAIVLVGTHFLVAARLYETVTLAILFALSIWYFKLRRRGWSAEKLRSLSHFTTLRVVAVADGVERGTIGWRERRQGRVVSEAPTEDDAPQTKGGNRLRTRLTRFAGLLLLVAPMAVVLGWSFWMRAELIVNSQTLSPPDAYVHMTWAKNITTNSIFLDGLYPQGMAAFLAFLSKWSFYVDILDVTRFTGPIIGTLIVFGIFFCGLRLTGNPGAAVFAAGTFGLLGTRGEWHEPWIRQTGPLPQEFAVALGLIALPFAVLAVQHRDRDHFITVGCAGVAMMLLHPVPVPFWVAMVGVASFLTAIFSGGLKYFKYAIGVTLVSGVGAAVGFLYYPIGLLLGIKVYPGITNFNPIERGGDPTAADTGSNLGQVVEGSGYNSLAYLAIIFAAIGLVSGLLLLFSKANRRRGASLIALAGVAGLLLALYDVRWIGLDPFYAQRVSNIVGPQIAIAFAAGLGALPVVLQRITRRNAFLGVAILVIVGVFSLVQFGNRFPAQARDRLTIAYESTADVTEDIKKFYERFTYTIIGIPQQRQQVLGDGFFIEQWVFARDVSIRSARDPGYQVHTAQGVPRTARDLGALVPVPTQEIFIFVEKEPFPITELPPRGPTEEYYFNQAKRGRIMTRTFVWCELYLRYHTDMKVYFEDDTIKVYQISRSPDVAGADDSPEFKDYTWEPGELFNEGPTKPSEALIP